MAKKLWFWAFLLLVLAVIGWYFFPVKYHDCLKVHFTKGGIPIVNIVIEDKVFPVDVSLASKIPLSLDKNILGALTKTKKNEIIEWRGPNGNCHNGEVYVIPNIKLGFLILDDVDAVESPEYEDILKGTQMVWVRRNEHLGSIGRPLLFKFNMLLDFPHARICFSNDLQKLKNERLFDESQFQKIPFEITRVGIVISIDTDIGIKKFALATGCSKTLLKQHLVSSEKCTEGKNGRSVFNNKKTVIGKENFGALDMFLVNITTELSEVDGFLGMDFLKRNVVYIDFHNKALYLKSRLR